MALLDASNVRLESLNPNADKNTEAKVSSKIRIYYQAQNAAKIIEGKQRQKGQNRIRQN